MEKPTIAGREPIAVDLKAGETYYFCACGKSSNQPFCDGSHQGTPFSPIAFSVEEDGVKHICACKQTKNPPYCDGSHLALGKEE